MFKVLAAGVVMANLAYFSRYWQPTGRRQAVLMGLQGAAAGCSLACIFAAVLAVCFPGPYHLGIYTIALNMLLTPGLGTFGIISGLRRLQKEAAPVPASFSQVMEEVAGPADPVCEEPATAES